MFNETCITYYLELVLYSSVVLHSSPSSLTLSTPTRITSCFRPIPVVRRHVCGTHQLLGGKLTVVSYRVRHETVCSISVQRLLRLIKQNHHIRHVYTGTHDLL